MTTRADIVAAARTWLGTPWHHQAVKKGIGCDCAGLVAGVALELGLFASETYFADSPVREYGRQPNPRILLSACQRYLTEIDRAAAGVGDVVLIRFEADPMHLAIITKDDPLYMIHALFSASRVVEHGIDNVWSQRIMRAYRYRGIV